MPQKKIEFFFIFCLISKNKINHDSEHTSQVKNALTEGLM